MRILNNNDQKQKKIKLYKVKFAKSDTLRILVGGFPK